MDNQANFLDGARILIVEDDYVVARNIAHTLRRLGAQIIGPASNVASALALIADNPNLDVALLDINLGAENAYPVASALRSRGIPFLFTTGYSRPSLPSEMVEAPLIEKPIDARALVSLLSALRTLH